MVEGINDVVEGISDVVEGINDVVEGIAPSYPGNHYSLTLVLTSITKR